MSHLTDLKSQLELMKLSSQSFSLHHDQKLSHEKINSLLETQECTIDITNPYVTPKYTEEQVRKIPVQYSVYSYTNFFERNLLRNVPCVITNVAINWPCMKTWVDGDKINFKYLRSKFGNATVPVANCNKKYFDSHEKITMKFSDYLDYFESSNKENLLYLKDWHCRKEFPLEDFYVVPKIFTSDWLNEYALATMQDDYMFVYMGPTGTWTPLHADVYNSYSWSVNITGCKKWRLYPPGQENLLRDQNGQLPFDVSTDELNSKNAYFLEIIQEKGDAIFIPSGWYHQVWNMEDTISVNHNWVNACNIRAMWQNLQFELKKVQKEISDCVQMDNWSEHCQLLLRVSFGMNYFDFYNFLHEISLRRIIRLKNTTDVKCFKYSLGINQCRFDLIQIHEVLVEYINSDVFVHMNTTFEGNLLELIEKILQVLGIWESILGKNQLQ